MGTTWSRGVRTPAADLQLYLSDLSMNGSDGEAPDVTHVRFELVTHGESDDAESGYEPDGKFITEIQRPNIGQHAVLRFNTLALHVLPDGTMKLYDSSARERQEV